jgi:hypothetical protein
MSASLPDNCLEWTRKFLDLDIASFNGSDDAPGGVNTRAGGTTASPPPAPDTPADPAKQTLYTKETGDSDDVSENDIHQGQVGDCFLLSSIGEIAKLRPDVIKKMIKDNGNGTYTVTLHKQDDGIGNAWGLFSHDYKEVKVTVTADVPAASVNHGEGQAEQDGKKEIWPLILEKAYAQVVGGYANLNKGGSSDDALATLTGHSASQKSVSKFSVDDLKDAMAKKKPLVFNTTSDGSGKKGDLPHGMHRNHSYTFEGVTTGADGKSKVILKNPWGFDNPEEIPFEDLGKCVETISVGKI